MIIAFIYNGISEYLVSMKGNGKDRENFTITYPSQPSLTLCSKTCEKSVEMKGDGLLRNRRKYRASWNSKVALEDQKWRRVVDVFIQDPPVTHADRRNDN